MDVDTIQAGMDFVDVLENAVQSCDVVVALLGRQWLNIKDEAGERRLDNPQDFVRIEVAAALSRGIRVIPVLVDGTSMPNSGELPDNLKPLARRNAVLVNHHSFHNDVNRLIEQLELALKAAEDSKILKAKKLKEEAVRKKRQEEIENLLSQAEIALDLQDWELAKEKLAEALTLEPSHTQTQIKLAIVERKQREEKYKEEKKATNAKAIDKAAKNDESRAVSRTAIDILDAVGDTDVKEKLRVGKDEKEFEIHSLQKIIKEELNNWEKTRENQSDKRHIISEFRRRTLNLAKLVSTGWASIVLVGLAWGIAWVVQELLYTRILLFDSYFTIPRTSTRWIFAIIFSRAFGGLLGGLATGKIISRRDDKIFGLYTPLVGLFWSIAWAIGGAIQILIKLQFERPNRILFQWDIHAVIGSAIAALVGGISMGILQMKLNKHVGWRQAVIVPTFGWLIAWTGSTIISAYWINRVGLERFDYVFFNRPDYITSAYGQGLFSITAYALIVAPIIGITAGLIGGVTIVWQLARKTQALNSNKNLFFLSWWEKILLSMALASLTVVIMDNYGPEFPYLFLTIAFSISYALTGVIISHRKGSVWFLVLGFLVVENIFFWTFLKISPSLWLANDHIWPEISFMLAIGIGFGFPVGAVLSRIWFRIIRSFKLKR